MVGASFMVDTPYYFMYGKTSSVTAMIYDKQIPKKDTLRSACSIRLRLSFIGEFTNKNITQEVNVIKTIEAYNTIINTDSRFINSFVS